MLELGVSISARHKLISGRLLELMPERLRWKVRHLGLLERSLEFISRHIDCTSSLAVGIGEMGEIYLRRDLSRREKEHVASIIVRRLASLRDAGRKLSIRFYGKRQIYRGPYTRHAPDILFTIQGLEYNQKPSIGGTIFQDSLQTGGHRMDGLIILKPGEGRAVKPCVGGHALKPSIYDVAPTILKLLDVEPPRSMDGRPLVE